MYLWLSALREAVSSRKASYMSVLEAMVMNTVVGLQLGGVDMRSRRWYDTVSCSRTVELQDYIVPSISDGLMRSRLNPSFVTSSS